MVFHALAEIAKNITIKIVAKGAPGAVAILGGGTVVGLTTGYCVDKYFKYKTRLAELDYQRAISTVEGCEHNRDHDDGDDNDGNDDGPTPIVS